MTVSKPLQPSHKITHDFAAGETVCENFMPAAARSTDPGNRPGASPSSF